MLTLRWMWGLGAFVLLGVLTSLVVNRCTLATVMCLLLVPPIAFLAPFALGQGARNLSTLRKQLAWWHALWLLMFLSTLVFRMRDVQAIRETAVDFWGAYRIVLVGTIGLVLALRLVLRQTEWIGSLFRGLVCAMALYAIICVVSISWSVYPAWTMYKSLEYLLLLALVAAILATVRSAEAFKTLFDWTWVLYGLLLASVWFGVLVWPQEALKQGVGLLGLQLYGVLPILHANTVGELGAILATVALARLLSVTQCRANRALCTLLFAVSLVTLILSQTRSAISGFLLGAAILFLFSRRTRAMAFVISAVAVLLLLTNAGGTFWAYFLRGQSPELFQSLSGRVGWWEFGLDKLLERPLTGYGAYAGGRFAVLEEMGVTSTASTHNAYFEVIIGTSFWGLIPVIIALMGIWWVLTRVLRSPSFGGVDRQLAVEAVGVLGVITVRSFLTSHLIWNTSLVFLLVLGYAEFLRRKHKSKAGTTAQLVSAERR